VLVLAGIFHAVQAVDFELRRLGLGDGLGGLRKSSDLLTEAPRNRRDVGVDVALVGSLQRRSWNAGKLEWAGHRVAFFEHIRIRGIERMPCDTMTGPRELDGDPTAPLDRRQARVGRSSCRLL